MDRWDSNGIQICISTLASCDIVKGYLLMASQELCFLFFTIISSDP
jgi:hypothetical protein